MEKKDLSGNAEYKDKFLSMQKQLNSWMESVVKSLNGDDYKK